MSAPQIDLEERDFLGITLHAATMEQVVARCEAAVDAGESLSIGVANAAKIVKMKDDPLLRESVTSSDLRLADGMAVVWASRLLGEGLPERVAGIDLFEELLSLSDRRGFSVYLLGADQETLERLVDAVHRRHPGARVAGFRNGYFSAEDEKEIVDEIKSASPDFLFLGFPTPKKERFSVRWREELGVPVLHGVGGSFDVLAGKTRRAPALLQRMGLEWAYRIAQEPRRLWKRYAVTNTLFGLEVLRSLLSGRRPHK